MEFDYHCADGSVIALDEDERWMPTELERAWAERLAMTDEDVEWCRLELARRHERRSDVR